jgi:hypothetical protein
MFETRSSPPTHLFLADLLGHRLIGSVALEDPSTYDHYLATEPGIYVREANYLAEHRPCLIASDTWALEVLGHPDVTWAFPVHQTLLTRWGIHIREGVLSDDLSQAGAYEFVYSYSPQRAYGATAGNVPRWGSPRSAEGRRPRPAAAGGPVLRLRRWAEPRHGGAPKGLPCRATGS